jgi:hypothetical protein
MIVKGSRDSQRATRTMSKEEAKRDILEGEKVL